LLQRLDEGRHPVLSFRIVGANGVSTPTLRIRSGCCALAARNAPPSSEMNARRHLVGAGEQRRIVGPDWRAIWFGKR
jgi:hypothetical protein